MNCRICGADKLEQVFSLGMMPLANHLLSRPDEPFERFPLDLFVCDNCTLAQLGETVPADKMFRDYNYLTSYSPELVKQAEQLVSRIYEERKPKFVVEAGSNDGYLLKHYVKHGVKVLGVDPSVDAVAAATLHDVSTMFDYFSEKVAKRIVRMRGFADVFHANNVLAHVPDPNDFVRGIKTLLKPDGVAIIEVQYAKTLSLDQIYHEHVFYFSFAPLAVLFNRNGLGIHDAEIIRTHGGSIRLFVKHGPVTGISGDCIDWHAWALRQEDVRDKLYNILDGLEDWYIAGFGAAAKATMLLNYLGEPSQAIQYVADDSPLKQGKWIPGTKIQVAPPSALKEDKPDYLFLFAWNFCDSIMARFPEFKGRFIIPFPNPRIM